MEGSSCLLHTSTQGSDSKPDSSLIWHGQNEDKWWPAIDRDRTKDLALCFWDVNNFLSFLSNTKTFFSTRKKSPTSYTVFEKE